MPLGVSSEFQKVSLKNVIKKINNSLALFDQWLGGDLTEEYGWRYIPAICFESEITNLEQEFCTESFKFIIHGNEIDDQVGKMFADIDTGFQNNQEQARKEFIQVAEFLLFFASFEPVVTLFGLSRKVAENVDKGHSRIG